MPEFLVSVNFVIFYGNIIAQSEEKVERFSCFNKYFSDYFTSCGKRPSKRQHIGSDQRLSQTSPWHKCTMAVAAAADKQAVLLTMLQQALRSFFRMVGVVAFKAVEFLRPQDVEHTLQSGPVKAAGGMRAQRCAAGSVNCCDYLADGRKFRKPRSCSGVKMR